MKYRSIGIILFLLSCSVENQPSDKHQKTIIHEVNEKEVIKGNKVIALVGGTLIDGKGGEPIQNSCVVIRNERIEAAGKSEEIKIPDDAEVITVKGQTILPGLIDAHYHNEESLEMAEMFLANGVTSVRDPGAWIEAYDSVRASGRSLPRLFLTGPHINTFPPAYPADSYIVQDAVEGRLAVDKLAGQGATAIKVYYGLPIGIIKEVCNAAHLHGLPVTAHLEITNAIDAINAGVDGIEHITSFGTVLLLPREAEKYKQKVMADNNARKRGRYEVWSSLILKGNPNADSLIRFLSLKKTFISPTLAIFEKRPDNGDSIEVNGFQNMVNFVGQIKKGGGRIVVGSHTWVPYAEPGLAYFREMELLHDAGLSNMEIIQAATLENARFLRIDERLGTIEKGKIADLIVVDGDPIRDIRDMRKIKKVMLNGTWKSGMKE
ncbi:MAG: amidohydrolase [Marivirga sp.]|nr:amidohydrolase [Marivirga sp.]